ncbi:MAG: hypothetical protein ACUVXI_04150 [bacterium]
MTKAFRVDITLCLNLLRDWSAHAERYWYRMPDNPQLGCYGTGYNNWGVQTNQKYLSAMAVLSVLGEGVPSIPHSLRDRARERALSALRFSLRSHVSGDYHCTDGTRWGHTWISALGLERMMHGVHLIEPHLTDEDRSAICRVLTSEADWLLRHHRRGAHEGVFADPWNHTGKNAPESNLWNGALLWRTAAMYPDHPDADRWREGAHRFLMNAISVSADAEDERIVAGRPIRDWHVGANFFPNYALDHHGYLNVGYMVICLSNAAMLHFDLKAMGLPPPESLYHHSADLWRVLRRMIFSDGRLARIGGDSRIRYAYCQEYLLPTLVYAADQLGEQHASHLIEAQLELILREAAFSGDGSFYGKRLASLAESNPYYYTRLESDRACVLGMLAAYSRQIQGDSDLPHVREATDPAERKVRIVATRGAFERSTAGHWCDPDYGVVLHRTPSRLASFAWRAHGLAQGMCQPPDDGHLAEWWQNLGGLVRFLGDDSIIEGGQTERRKLIGYHIDTFSGGFVTCGAVMEGVGIKLKEGWSAEESALHQIAFVALPDEHTVIGFQHCRTVGHRTYVAEVKGLHLNLPNDLYNHFKRLVITAREEISLESPPGRDQVVDLGSTWANVDGRLGVVGLYGAKQLAVHRSCQRRGGRYASLYVDEICFHCALATKAVDPHTVILDVGWAVLSDASSDETGRFAQLYVAGPTDSAHPHIRWVRVRGLDGRDYVVLANFGAEEQACPAPHLFDLAESAHDFATGEDLTDIQNIVLITKPCQARVFVLNA